MCMHDMAPPHKRTSARNKLALSTTRNRSCSDCDPRVHGCKKVADISHNASANRLSKKLAHSNVHLPHRFTNALQPHTPRHSTQVTDSWSAEAPTMAQAGFHSLR